MPTELLLEVIKYATPRAVEALSRTAKRNYAVTDTSRENHRPKEAIVCETLVHRLMDVYTAEAFEEAIQEMLPEIVVLTEGAQKSLVRQFRSLALAWVRPRERALECVQALANELGSRPDTVTAEPFRDELSLLKSDLAHLDAARRHFVEFKDWLQTKAAQPLSPSYASSIIGRLFKSECRRRGKFETSLMTDWKHTKVPDGVSQRIINEHPRFLQAEAERLHGVVPMRGWHEVGQRSWKRGDRFSVIVSETVMCLEFVCDVKRGAAFSASSTKPFVLEGSPSHREGEDVS